MSQRILKVNQLIKKELSQIILKEAEFPKEVLVTLTRVETLPNLQIVGLMTMAPLTDDEDICRFCFARLREIFEEIRGERIAGARFKHLSMGMSQDFEIAVEEGATLLRIGSAVFN